jgi:hypothetical protein
MTLVSAECKAPTWQKQVKTVQEEVGDYTMEIDHHIIGRRLSQPKAFGTLGYYSNIRRPMVSWTPLFVCIDE